MFKAKHMMKLSPVLISELPKVNYVEIDFVV